jgi:hypothetical protein
MRNSIRTTATAIMRHMSHNPQAKHSVEGIAHYWLFQQKLEEQVDQVLYVLHYLSRRGLLLEEKNPDGSAYYKLNTDRLDDINSFLTRK